MCKTLVSNVATGLRVWYNTHEMNQETKEYFDTGSMALACTAGSCDVVDLTKG